MLCHADSEPHALEDPIAVHEQVLEATCRMKYDNCHQCPRKRGLNLKEQLSGVMVGSSPEWQRRAEKHHAFLAVRGALFLVHGTILSNVGASTKPLRFGIKLSY